MRWRIRYEYHGNSDYSNYLRNNSIHQYKDQEIKSIEGQQGMKNNSRENLGIEVASQAAGCMRGETKMGKYRAPSKSNKYYIPTEDYITAIHWCLRYPLWVSELSVEPDTSRAITYDQDKVQTSGDYDPTVELAMKRAEIYRKKELLENTIRECAPEELFHFILLHVGHGRTYYQLVKEGLNISEYEFRKYKQKFYYEISQKI